jgi:hypothetical protein
MARTKTFATLENNYVYLRASKIPNKRRSVTLNKKTQDPRTIPRVAAFMWADKPNNPGPKHSFIVSELHPKMKTAYVFGGWDSQEQAGTGGVILNDIPSFTATTFTSDEWKTLPVTLGDPTSRLVVVAISDDTILIHNHRCVDHVLVLLKDGRVMTQPTAGEAPRVHGDCMRLAESEIDWSSLAHG